MPAWPFAHDRPTPLAALGRGALAGGAGAAVMAAYQMAGYRLRGSPVDRTLNEWESAPPPAKAGKRLVEGVFRRGPVGSERITLATSAVHFAYGAAWGGAYGLVEGTLGRRAAADGLALGLATWALSLPLLPAARLAPPPWRYGLGGNLFDLSYHLVYGAVAGAAWSALARR